MSDFFTNLENIIVSKVKEPTIVNTESDFVVVTYWWGRGNMNANIARPCMEFWESYINELIDITIEYIRMVLDQDMIRVENIDSILDNLQNDITNIPTFKSFISRISKKYLGSIYVDIGLLDGQNTQESWKCLKSILNEMKRSLTCPKNFNLIEEVNSPEDLLNRLNMIYREISMAIIVLLKENIYKLFYEEEAVTKLKIAKERGEINVDTAMEILKGHIENREQLLDDNKKLLKLKQNYIIADNEHNNMNIFDILNDYLRFRDAKFFQDMITNWENECQRHGCNYLSIEYPEFAAEGGYQLAINAKPLFVKHALNLCSSQDKSRAVVYIDGDMFIKKYPSIFDMKNIDYMSRGWSIDPRASWKSFKSAGGKRSITYNPYKFETSGGIMYFSQSPESVGLLNEWIDESSKERNKGKADDRIISIVFNSKRMLLNMNIIQLPIEYLWLTLDMDENMLEEEYDWNKKLMDSTIMVEHPECLTSEETAKGQGASSSRQPKFYDFIENDEEFYPVSEEFHEYLAFPNEEMVEEIRPYLDYMKKTYYIDDGDERLVDLGFVDPDDENNNEQPLYITDYSDRYGRRESIAIQNESIIRPLIDLVEREFDNITKKIDDDTLVICDENLLYISQFVYKSYPQEFILPLVIILLEMNYKVIYRPQRCEPYCYVDLIKSKSLNLDLAFIPAHNRMTNQLKPIIDLSQPIYFNKSSEHSIITKILLMFNGLEDLSKHLNNGSYEIMSRIRVGYIYKGKGEPDANVYCNRATIKDRVDYIDEQVDYVQPLRITDTPQEPSLSNADPMSAPVRGFEELPDDQSPSTVLQKRPTTVQGGKKKTKKKKKIGGKKKKLGSKKKKSGKKTKKSKKK